MSSNENKLKSQRGNDFNHSALLELKKLKTTGFIDNIDIKKKFPFKEGFNPQFYVPFMVVKDNKNAAIFPMNTMRSDRNKEKQWDAYGVKNYFKDNIKVIVVLPDNLIAIEKKYYEREKEKIKIKGYLSKIDEICQLSDLKHVL